MLQNAREQFVRTILLVAVVALLALSVQGVVLFNQGSSASFNPYAHAWVPSGTDDAGTEAIACNVPPPGSGGGGGGC